MKLTSKFRVLSHNFDFCLVILTFYLKLWTYEGGKKLNKAIFLIFFLTSGNGLLYVYDSIAKYFNRSRPTQFCNIASVL